MTLNAVAIFAANARVGFTMPMFGLAYDMAAHGLPVIPALGNEWHSSITQSIEAAVEKFGDRKYILFYDGDGFWTEDDLRELYRRIEADETIDAIFPTQACRTSNERPLCWGWQTKDYDGPELNYDGLMQEQQHGHFACTFIRMDVFRRLPRPWIQPRASKTGQWDYPNCMSSDTSFWLQLWHHNRALKNGHRVVQANDIVVGHGEFMVRWTTPRGVVMQPLGQWMAERKPPAAVRCPTRSELGFLPTTET